MEGHLLSLCNLVSKYCKPISICVFGHNTFLQSHQELIEAYDITDTMIQPLNNSQAE